MTGYQNPPPGYPPGYYPQPNPPAGPAPGGFVPQAPPVAPSPPPGYGYPGQPPAAPAPYGYPPQAPQQPFQAAYGAPAGYPAAPGFGPPPMPPMAAPPPPSYAAPTIYIPDQAAMNEALARAKAALDNAAKNRGRGGAPRPGDFKFPAPGGGFKWGAHTIGKELSIYIRILPAGAQGQPFFVDRGKHFFPQAENPSKYHSGWCQGSSCPVCAEIQKMLGSVNADVQAKAKRARAKDAHLFQVVAWSDEPMVQAEIQRLHIGEDGRFRPLLWEFPAEVYKQTIEILGARGAYAVLDLERGTPLKVTKKKTGTEDKDVEYRVIDMTTMAGPLPSFYGIGPRGEGLELLNLEEWARPMSAQRAGELVADLQKYAARVGANAGPSGPAPQTHAYSAAPPAAPSPSPWGQPQAPQQPAAPWTPPAQLPNVGAPAQAWGPPPGPAAPAAPQYPAPPAWQGAQPEAAAPPALPAGDAHAAAGFPGPRTSPPTADPWAGQVQEPPAWQPPPPQAAPAWQPPQAHGGPGAMPPGLLALSQQMTGAAPIPDPQPSSMGPAFPAPPVGAPPPR